jgi:hypothetical protein
VPLKNVIFSRILVEVSLKIIFSLTFKKCHKQNATKNILSHSGTVRIHREMIDPRSRGGFGGEE